MNLISDFGRGKDKKKRKIKTALKIAGGLGTIGTIYAKRKDIGSLSQKLINNLKKSKKKPKPRGKLLTSKRKASQNRTTLKTNQTTRYGNLSVKGSVLGNRGGSNRNLARAGKEVDQAAKQKINKIIEIFDGDKQKAKQYFKKPVDQQLKELEQAVAKQTVKGKRKSNGKLKIKKLRKRNLRLDPNIVAKRNS